MDIVNFLNKTFYKEGSYFVLLALSLVWILMDSGVDKRGKRMAVYAVATYALVIWNPLVAPYGLLFFGEDMYAYMRIFYLIPYMTILAYGGTAIYTHYVTEHSAKGRKLLYMALLIITVALSGKTYGKAMYRGVTNPYKINQEAYEISNLLMEDADGARPVAWVPKDEELWYGIRQYEGHIILEGDSNRITTWTELYDSAKEHEFRYVIFAKDGVMNGKVSAHCFTELGQTQNYIIYKKTES